MAGNDLIWRFTPTRTEPDVLEEIFVQRGALLTDLVERVSESALTGNKHQILLVGPRGIGKTHLIALVHHRVLQDSALLDKVRIAWFLEDETITSFVQLLKRIYELLAEAYPSEFPQDWLEDLLDRPPTKILKALETVLADKFRDKTLLLLVENLDLIFEGLGDAGQTQWRAFLQTHPFTSIVATSQRLFRSVKSRERPFFGFFATTHLHPLRSPDAVELLRRIASHRKQSDLIEFLATAEGRSRVRALHHLAGGNHRIYVVLSGFITRESLDELVGPFETMADELTPYYQERMRWLTPQQRQIVEYLCAREDTCTPKEIARHLLTTENTISSQLKKLLELGYLLRNPRGRESLYELAEPLMRLASEVKERPSKPLRLLVNFLRVWYRPDVLPQLLAKACSPSLRIHIEAAISEALFTPDPRFRILEDEIEKARQENSHDDLVKVLEELAHARGSAKDWFELAFDHFDLKDFEAAVECLDKTLVTDPKNTGVWTIKGFALDELSRREAAVGCYDKALEIDSRYDSAWYFKGRALAKLGRNEAAIDSFDRALELDPRNAPAWDFKGRALFKLGRHEAAIDSFDKVLELDPRNASAWDLKGRAQYRLGRHEDAIDSFDKALELDPRNAPAWLWKGVVLGEQGRHEVALGCCDKALELDARNGPAWVIKAWTLHQLGRHEAAVECEGKAIELDPRNGPAWVLKGVALEEQGRHEAAVECYTKALGLEPQVAPTWVAKGATLYQLGRHAAAVECYEKALEIDSRNPSYWKYKGDSLNELRRYEEAIECLDKSLDIDPRDVYAWNQKGHALARLGRHEAARECFERVLELDSTDPDWVFSRCDARFALRQWETGFHLLREAFERSPGDAEHEVRSFIDLIQRLSDGREDLRQHLATLITIYHKSGVLAYLGGGLVRSLRRIDVGQLGVETLNAWQESWQDVGGGYPELEIPLRIFRVGIAYLARGDAKCLLDLVTVERTLLREAIGLDIGADIQ